MILSLDKKRAFVCGSTQGIGRACAEVFARLGAVVTLVGRDADALARVRAELAPVSGQQHDTLRADFAAPTELRRIVEEHTRRNAPYHILLNNTGGPPAGALLESTPDQLLDAFQKHIVCAQHLAQCLVPGMKQYGYGRIINIVSTSVREPIAGLGVSNTTRGAMASWAKTLSREVGPYGITVNNILPGFTETARLDALLAGRAQRENRDKQQLIEALKAEIPVRRFARPEETANAAAFLASAAAAYITGVSLPVDGGRLASI
ncbi:MAG: SDR family oxidoreductase [Planctomycetota bacterium]